MSASHPHLPSSLALGALLSALALLSIPSFGCDGVGVAAPRVMRLPIEPIQQAPGLCGVAAGEMILTYYGVGEVGEGYVISPESGGAALGQALCDLLAAGEGDQQQPRCVDGDKDAIPVYAAGKPTARTREAYPDGTYLSNVAALLKGHGVQTEYRRSAYDKERQVYRPEAVAPGFTAMLTHLKAGHPAIFHVTPRLTRGGGHYLLAVGYDEGSRRLYYVDPNPAKGAGALDSAPYDAVAGGQGFFRGSWFFTGRYLAVTDAPRRP